MSSLRLGALALLVLAAGCPQALPPVQRPYAPPSADELVRSLRERAAKLRAVEAEARAEQVGPGKQQVKVKLNAWAERPDRLRLEIVGPLNSGAATLVSDGKQFALLDAKEGRLFTGEARGCNLARLVQVELEPTQAVAVLLGDIPLEEGQASVAWDEHEGGRELLSLRLPDGGQERVWLDARDRRWDPLKAERLEPDGRLRWRVEHGDWADLDGRRQPGRTSLRDERRGAEIRLRWKERSLDPQLREEGFHLEPGPGIVAEVVGCES